MADANIGDKPYIVLLGDVGTGKSTLVEKLTNATGRSDDSSVSYTRISKQFWSKDGSLLICDIPGSNAMDEPLEHNLQIAAAFNFEKVSRILIVVSAETRIDNVIRNARTYAESIIDLPTDIVGVIVTHMDTVSWDKNACSSFFKKVLGIEKVVYCGINTPYETLQGDLLRLCEKKFDLFVNHENFLRLFKIHDNKLKIIQDTKREVEAFKELKRGFDRERKYFYSKQDQVDLVFEFQAWMADMITVAQKKLADENQFTFLGNEAANEAGHVANMTNQMRLILQDIRIEAVGLQSEHGVSDLRKCPHCGRVWMKIEGCDGDTTCGSRPSRVLDSLGEMATFTFSWVSKKLNISKTGKKMVKASKTDGKGYGCGKNINWKNMSHVDVPPELSQAIAITTEDIKVMPMGMGGEFNKNVDDKLKRIGKKMEQEKISKR